MELRHLRYFVAVAEECHFGRAAERLHIAQPPLSQQIKQLEAHLGVTLLTRSTRRVELTAAGAAYLDHARAILASVDRAADDARRVADGCVGRVAIGFTGSATYELLPRLARVLRAELPDVEVELHGEILTPGQVARLHDGSLDVGVLRPPVEDDALDVHLLRREPLVAVLPDAHPLVAAPGISAVRLADLAGESFVTYPSGHRSVVHEAVLAACRAAGFEPQPVAEVAETSTLVSFVAAGLGVALVPESVQHLRITGAAYRPLAGTAPSVDLGVATRRGEDAPVVRRVLDLLGAIGATPLY
ncbi:LysR substrate-binding domain-containing protein [Nocardioides zeae]|uniref:DNA-binding transcriptional LysR family regulator n=1 Tax=Nocardioides zeae TaxID=1457234 RepID=A0AAJ1U7N4_9ACTN|nr:LysR substrate-binding domain-containing protein [Nocardioides zeae]MDQ1105677.1 DNA-binding transcriptional LysR family regulator [Nocardioides zeae]